MSDEYTQQPQEESMEQVEDAPVLREAIERRAYEISLSADAGSDEENWRRAEQELGNSPAH